MARDKLTKTIEGEIKMLRVVRSVFEGDYPSIRYFVPYDDRLNRQKSEESWKDDIAQLKKILADYQAAMDEEASSDGANKDSKGNSHHFSERS